MAEKRIVNSRYIYIHETVNSPKQRVDVHHLVTRINSGWKSFAFFSAFVLLFIAFYLFLRQEIQFSVILMCLSIGVVFIRLLRRKVVEKELVVIIPAFGVQLETHYRSGRTVRRFVPIDKILKPILNECVTPVTCYWSLALLLREEDELMLVFKKLRPPLKMLLPIWKALCIATDSSEGLETQSKSCEM